MQIWMWPQTAESDQQPYKTLDVYMHPWNGGSSQYIQSAPRTRPDGTIYSKVNDTTGSKYYNATSVQMQTLTQWSSLVTDASNKSSTIFWQVWLEQNDDLYGRCRYECGRKRTNKIWLQVEALYTKVPILLACDKIIFDTPVSERLKSTSRRIETWLCLI